MQIIDNIPLFVLIVLCLLLGLAPFVPEPHIVEKLRMLIQGNLRRPIDIFDLFYHAAPFVLLVIKLIRLKNGAPPQ
ncbi:MAG: RND transporter [Proteobacteria bacterium]|nr:RND transporter [Pseudomonadota bacterium]MBU1232805.1 RND transporter [Pseudomonadota bacterium]MBU1420393.1 RND transporter [Pseudomonadota bacterium]MBU1454403.1 RND transporter [Pseudomonadota bacterium]